MGAANEYDEIWPVLLERRLSEKGFRVDIVKAGIESFDTGSELIMMHRLVPKYHPDLVLMAFLPNDIFDNKALRAALTPARQLAAGLSFTNLESVALFKRVLLSNDFAYSAVYWMTSRRQYFTEVQTSHAAEQYAITRELLSRASQYASLEGSRFAVASIPQCFQVLAKADHLRPQIASTCRTTGVSVVVIARYSRGALRCSPGRTLQSTGRSFYTTWQPDFWRVARRRITESLRCGPADRT
jgi:hypothetical protein